ncbi:hypothetical protein EV182_002040 [Spiromyces aspiralis]|uniref:Uncharacterized protein n=1 Tax=Spiromyces aspiralis TaxID=68401 RepID=A0ACC1HHC1_9FUNG|nr:hypothetical protein EV182_002040 [Spiromyces aspiralis]
MSAPQQQQQQQEQQQAQELKTFEFEVEMACGGCSGAVKRALDNASEKGTYKLNVVANHDNNKVTVTAPMTSQITEKDLLVIIYNTNKRFVDNALNEKAKELAASQKA